MKLIRKDIDLRAWIITAPWHDVYAVNYYSTFDFYFYTQLPLTEALDHSKYNLLRAL